MKTKRDNKAPTNFKAVFLAIVIAVALGSFLWWVRDALDYRHPDEARAYVAHVVPLLDAYKQKHGHYPKSLDQVQVPPAPKLLAGPHSYSTEGEGDHFIFSCDPIASLGLVSGTYYHSKFREWHAK